MSEHLFFNKKNKGNVRKVTLQTYTGLVGKAPTKQKRLKMKLQIILGDKMGGYPEWITAAFEFVAKNHDPVVPTIDFKGFDIEFSGDHLFGDRVVKATKCQMRSFEIHEVGDSENPDVAMTFVAYGPFSDKLNRWLGQMNGEEFWARFEQVIEEAEEEKDDEESLELTGEEPEEESDEEPGEDDDEGEESEG